MFINEKNILRDFTWGLANDLHICKKYEIPAKHAILI